ncbi:unnamed protein product [Fraxinus pennsylvanica]|uniref:Uncharacterized protein n=1 Tax=Fraxinus pennsylvanica TaxID=56036 RepID=A0AAD2A5C6_9LAMI|nr:unnamed protein product [Fraxinus pennsylvanica]
MPSQYYDEDDQQLQDYGHSMAHILGSYLMPMINAYLINVWQLNFIHVSGIVIICEGMLWMLPLFFFYLSDAVLSLRQITKITSIFYTASMVFLSMSAPPILSTLTGTCGGYRPECFGLTQRILFFTSLVLFTVGSSGNIFIAGLQYEYLLSRFPLEFRSDLQKRLKKSLSKQFAHIGGASTLSFIKPWALRFGIIALLSAIGTCLSLGPCYPLIASTLPEENMQKASPLTNMIRVFVASALKISQKLPNDTSLLYEKNDEPDVQLLPHTPGLRFLDKAAILLPNKSRIEQENNKWSLCTVTQVEETKIAIRMFPMWMTFIICGLVTSIGYSYFLIQANNLNPKLAFFKLPFLFLPMLHNIVKPLLEKTNKYFTPQEGIGMAMICSVLCCITAALVEARRLHIVISHGLLDKPEERIPMSVLWLAPQFFLLAGLESFFERSVKRLFSDKIPPSSRKYLNYFTDGIFGLGIMGGVLSVYLAGKLSERGGKPNWFQDTLNRSRLDNYYWTLAALGAANFLLYILVLICFRNPKSNYEEADVNGEFHPLDS